MSLRIPESIHGRIRELAKKEGVSINQLINSALTEKISALMTLYYLRERACRGDRTNFEELLSRIPYRKPLEGDEL